MIRPTSSWANRRRSKFTAAELRRAICHRLTHCGPKTREHLAIIIGVSGDSLRPRCRELIQRRCIRVCASTYGKTKAGNKAELLAVTAKGARHGK